MKMSSEKCPDCGSRVVLKEGKYGLFFGCTSYPKCRFTADYECSEDGFTFSMQAYEDLRFEDELHGVYIASLNGY